VGLLLFAACGPAPQAGAESDFGASDGLSFELAIALEDSAQTTANASLGDLDGDSDLDLVLAKGRHWPLLDLVLYNDGHGGFAERHAVGPNPDRTYTAALADLDGDGDLDLVVGNDRPDAKVVHLNDGTGRFEPGGTFGDPEWRTRNITVADLNGDGSPDVVVANRGGPENQSKNFVCLNDGRGAFHGCSTLSGESATTIAAADVNGDGSVDLVVPHRDGGQSYVFLNDGSGGFPTPLPLGPADAATRAVAVGDITGDGLPDLVLGDGGRGGAALYINAGDGAFTGPAPIGDASDTPYAIAVADLNGDQALDVVLGNDETPGLILVNRGTPGGLEFDTLRFGDGAGAVYGLAIGDVNGDGCPDIVAARSEALSMLYVNGCD